MSLAKEEGEQPTDNDLNRGREEGSEQDFSQVGERLVALIDVKKGGGVNISPFFGMLCTYCSFMGSAQFNELWLKMQQLNALQLII